MTVRHTCATCIFWQRPTQTGNIDLRNPTPGECHHGPPSIQTFPMMQGGQQMLQHVSFWPPKNSVEWCGQHQNFGIDMLAKDPKATVIEGKMS